jgi:biopolymer transport protein TolQ
MPTTPGHIPNALDLVRTSSTLVQIVLLILLFASVFSWAIIVWKSHALRRAKHDNRRFLEAFWRSRSLEDIPARLRQFPSSSIAVVFASGLKELQKLPSPAQGPLPPALLDNVARALSRAVAQEVAEMETRVGWLATIGNASPFIGLFGTVWGIMGSFQGIGARGSASLAVVAPGISEALIATATGLAAAIPAVVAYNHFVGQIRRQAIDLEGFSQDFLNIVQQSYLDGSQR